MKIEIKLMSCKGLTAFNFFQKLSIYTNACIKCEDHRLELTPEQKQEQKTPVDEEGDGNPEWDHTITFDLRPLESINSIFENLSVVFEFRHQGQLFGDKTVGEVRVPLKTLVESVGINVVRFVSYEVRSPDGKHNGIFDFSYKISTLNDHDHDNHLVSSSEIHISGYHNHHQEHCEYHSHVSEYNQIHHGHGHGQILHHTHQLHHNLDPHLSSDSGRIEYPRIELDNLNSNTFTPVDGNQYYPQFSGVYPPPSQYQFAPPPANFPPPPAPPVVYPVRPYGGPHWGDYRPPGSYQPNGRYDGYHLW